jgi:hypothetical protein
LPTAPSPTTTHLREDGVSDQKLKVQQSRRAAAHALYCGDHHGSVCVCWARRACLGRDSGAGVRVPMVQVRPSSGSSRCWGRRCGDKAIRELGRATGVLSKRGVETIEARLLGDQSVSRALTVATRRACAGVPLRPGPPEGPRRRVLHWRCRARNPKRWTGERRQGNAAARRRWW